MKMKEFGFDKINRFCLNKHHLTDGSKIDDILKITEDICGLHATSSQTLYISLFVRMNNFEREDLNQFLYTLRDLGKIRFVRGTMYVLTKEMIPIAFSATKGIFSSLSERYAQYHGINKREYNRLSKKVLNLLSGQSMTVTEIKEALGDPSKISPMINLMCDSGLLIRSTPRAGWKSNLHTYQPMDEYFPGIDLYSYDEDEARRAIVKRYIATFGPVSTIDISWWTGFTKTETRGILEELEDEILQISISGVDDRNYLLESDERSLKSTRGGSRPLVTLLPQLDPYIMGYKDRERYLDKKYNDYIFDRSGNGVATIMVDGNIVGVWDFEEKPKALVKFYLFKKVLKDSKSEIRKKAQEIGTFIAESDVKVKECKRMKPLSKRTAGGFMSPLKGCK